ncbi:MAG: hypothetical protein GXP25_17570 [Planctomycetes bacterium]|nr:hypothetical protein [Planctomycetota bacterium]
MALCSRPSWGNGAVGFAEDHPEIVSSVSAMEKAGIPHHCEIIPGGHKISTVLTAWPKALAFHLGIWK